MSKCYQRRISEEFRMFVRHIKTTTFAMGMLAGVLISLTASADIVAPDGVSYPDWHNAGVPGGIPEPSASDNIVNVATSGNFANNLDAAIQTAHNSASGGGVISIPAGTFYLSRPVLIPWNNIVLRGAGSNDTRLIFNYQPPVSNVTFYQPASGVTDVYSNTYIQIHADPNNLTRLEILAKVDGADDSTLQSCVYCDKEELGANWGATFSVSTIGSTVISKTSGAGDKVLVARATYAGNPVVVKEARITCNISSSSDANAIVLPGLLGAINFCGSGVTSSAKLLTANGVRGQNMITLATGHGLIVGDAIELRAPATDAWDELVENACTGDMFRYYQFKVINVSGNIVTLNQPMRIDYPISDDSYVVKIKPIIECGVENMSLQQTYNLWTSGIMFSWSWKGWMKDVKVIKAGRFPFNFSGGKWCEVRDCVFDDAWFKEGGGTAYVGFGHAYDCLMDSVTTYKMRHAPILQWSAAGNVIRNSTFYDSDAQWHAGWTNENLFENCTVISTRGNGSSGYGMYSTTPEDIQHGPNGPRNVIYNCDIASPRTGVWLGGMNRDWIFMHNRFAVDYGSGIFARKNSGGHIIGNNIFVLRQANEGIRLDDADCTGVELVGNLFIGLPSTNEIVSGLADPILNSENVTEDLISAVSFSNNGFESGNLTGWSSSSTGVAVNSNAAYTGSYGIRITDNSTSGYYITSQSFPVTVGKVYAASCANRLINGSGASIYLKFYNEIGSEIGSYDSPFTCDDWQMTEAIGTAPPNATSAKVKAYTYSASTVTLDVDDFTFGELTHEIPNSGFELGTQGWNFTSDNGMSSVITATTTDTAHSGTKFLRVIDSSTTAGSFCATTYFPASANNTYQVRCWCRSNAEKYIGVYLKFYNSSYGEIDSELLNVPASADWKEYLTRKDAPAGTAYVRVVIHSYNGVEVTADFDDFTLLELPLRPTPPTSMPSIFEWQLNPVFPMDNAGFELGNLTGWNNSIDHSMSAVITAAKLTGNYGLRVTDASNSTGSWLASQTFPVSAGIGYKVSLSGKVVSGSGIGVYLKFQNAAGTDVTVDNNPLQVTATSWTALNMTKTAPTNAVTAKIVIHSYNASIVTADFDDFVFRAVLP